LPGSCRSCAAEIPDGETLCPACTPRAGGASDREAPPELPPRYQVLRPLGRGGMGRVYLCRDRDLDVEVAVKVLPPELAADEDALEEIRREARLTAKLREAPGIIVLYGLETFGDTNLLVMEYAPGGSLRERLKREPRLAEAECRKIGLGVLRALAHAHRHKVLHRDIKPANVLFDRSGRARVADFGLARVLADASTRTSMRAVAGTPWYIPPEVIRQEPADGRSDLYSLGCMLYEMSVGTPPFAGTISEVVSAKLAAAEEGTPDPRARRPELSEAFGEVVRKLMAADPSERFPDAESAFFALRGAAATGRTAPGEESDESLGLPRRRPSLLVALSAVVVLLVAGLLVAILARDGGETDSTDGGGTDVASAGPTAEPEPPADPPVDPEPETPPVAAAPEILVLTDPLDAVITVDGEERGRTGEDGLLLTDLSPEAPVSLAVSHPGCEPREVVWKPGDPRELRVTLVRKTGTLLFRSGVPGAAVEARRKGAAPRDLTLAQDGTLGPVRFAFGTYEVVVSKHGFHTRTLSVRVVVGEEATVDASLVEKDGRLTVDSDPSGAEVFVDGTSLGRTPLDAVAIGPGRRRLRLEHPERDPLVRDEIVVRGDRDVDLGVLPLPPLAVLDLRSLPPDVKASIDGEVVAGEIRRRSGKVELRLDRPKHRPRTFLLMLISGKTMVPPPGEWEPLPGRLDLTGLPEKLDVLVDGRLVPDLSAPVPAAAGEHRVGLYRVNFIPVRLTVRVAPEETAALPEIRWTRKWFRAAVDGLDAPPEPELDRIALPVGVQLHERRIYWEKDGAELAIVPAGSLSREVGEEQVDVPVGAFLMDRHEVTQKQFARFAKETGYVTVAEQLGNYRHWRQRVRADDRLPVCCISWVDAAKYAAWAGKRLPTEAEFEWALRGGRNGTVYPWGDEPPSGGRLGNFADRAFGRRLNRPYIDGYDDRFEDLAPVGSFDANPLGLFDVSGNLWEWVSDRTGELRVLRGGSWTSLAAGLANRARVVKQFDFVTSDIGFRCVVDLPR
jgi:predicted Ser/Thr protein kinase